MNSSENKNRLAAILLTLLVSGGVVALLLTAMLSVNQANATPTELAQDSIIFGGDYVLLGDMPEPIDSEEMAQEEPVEQPEKEVTPEPKVDGADLRDHGNKADNNKPLVSSKTESPMKVKEEPKKEDKKKPTGTAKPDKDQKQEQNQRATASNNNKANNTVRNAFANNGNGKGSQGSPNGNSTTGGSMSGQPGLSGLVGYTAERWGRPHSPFTGSVKVKVRVNARGQVVDAVVVGGTGEAYRSQAVKNDCVKESKKSAFSVPKNRTTEGIGYITWKFV